MTVLAADDRAYLTAEVGDRYALGDPAGPTLVLNAVDAFGCMWWCEEPDAAAGPTMTTPMDRRQNGDGGYAGEPTAEPLTVTLTGTVAAPTPAALRAAHRRLLAAWAGAAPAFTRYTHLDAAPARGLWVLPVGTPKWKALDDRLADFSIIVTAEDPVWTGTATAYGPVRLPTATGDSGYPMGAGGAIAPWTASGSASAVTVVRVPNDGDEDSHTVYTVTGPVPSPRIVLGTGAYVQLNADLAAADTWVVDTAAGTSTVNGVNRYDAWGAGSTFPLIPGGTLDPVTGLISGGGTELRLRSATGGTDQTAGLTALTAPSWR